MSSEDLPLLPLLRRAEPIMEGQLPSPPPSPTEAASAPLQFELPTDLVHPDIANVAKLAYGSAIQFHAAWDHRVRDRAGTDRDIKPQLRPTTYEMIMTLLTLETPKPLPTEPLPPPTAPARPPFQLKLLPGIDIEESVKDLEAVVYHFTLPESLLQLFTELGQLIWSNDWLRFFLIRQPYRPPVGADLVCGVLRWWLCTDETIIAAFLAQKMDPRLKAEVNYYIPAAQGIMRFKERKEMWAMAIDEVAKVRRKLDAGVSMVFHAKLAEERDRAQKDTPPPAPSKRRTPRSSLDRELRVQCN
jgi:hypothetical protein